ncbi:hypothetical protein PR048_008199 [Dryococelus australis]|uniref:Uncharacterized protein n=1 Tax=Dryococelus australis TaxID=614101 RepID=A0ABQ9HWF1_9NEOP|nr:hypothetical protein PR048_008199 [Dryococelus australis]
MQEDVSFYASGSRRQGKLSNLQPYNKPNSSRTPIEFPFNNKPIKMKDDFLCGDLLYNLISISKIENERFLVIFSFGAIRIVENGVTCI